MRRVAVLFAVAALSGAGAVGQAAATPVGHAAKSCSAGYKKATINGASKCLHTGQFCSKGANYSRYGFKCKPGSDGRNRLFKS